MTTFEVLSSEGFGCVGIIQVFIPFSPVHYITVKERAVSLDFNPSSRRTVACSYQLRAVLFPESGKVFRCFSSFGAIPPVDIDHQCSQDASVAQAAIAAEAVEVPPSPQNRVESSGEGVPPQMFCPAKDSFDFPE